MIFYVSDGFWGVENEMLMLCGLACPEKEQSVYHLVSFAPLKLE